MQSNNWRVIKDDTVFASNGWVSFGVGIVRENACAPDDFFWSSQHPLWGMKGNQRDDIAVPADLIAKNSSEKVMLTISRDEFLALPQRWQVERMRAGEPVAQTTGEQFRMGFAQGRAMDHSGIENTQAHWNRVMRAIDPNPEASESQAGRPESKPRTVLSAYEAAIEEMASVERSRKEMIEQHGELSPEMEELFSRYRKAVRDLRMAQFEQEVGDLMGTAVHHGR